jgi:L-serine deaminase
MPRLVESAIGMVQTKTNAITKDAHMCLEVVGFAAGMVQSKRSVVVKAAVTFPSKAEFVSDMVPR